MTDMTALLHRIPWEAPASLAAAAILLAMLPRCLRAARMALSGWRREASDWTRPQLFLAAALVILGIGITVPAFTEIYLTVTHLVRPAFGAWSWTVPVSGEIAFAYLFLNGVLLAMRRAPAGAMRSVLMAAIIAGSVVLNIWAYLGSVPSVVGHLIIVVAFFGVLMAGKETLMTLRGGKIRADRLTAGEWIAQPWRSLALWRWMKIWAEPSRKVAHERYMRLLFAFTVAKADSRIGRVPFRWRSNLPDILRYEFATGFLPASTASGDNWQEAIAEHVGKRLEMLPARATREATIKVGSGAAAKATLGPDAGPLAVPAADPAGGPPARPRRRAIRLDKSPDAEQARADYRASVRRGEPLSDRALGEKFGKSRTWGASRIAEVGAGPSLAKPATTAAVR
jgi:hypothetical protein